MELLITDVTVMHGGNFCVAGWDSGSGKMVRPLPSGHHWSSVLIATHNISPGAVIRVQPVGTPNGGYPHLTEDTPIDPSSVELLSTGFSKWSGDEAPPVVASIAQGFGGNVQSNSIYRDVHQGVYVTEGIQCPSLAAIQLPRQGITLVEDFGKLKAVVSDGSARYKLAVSSWALREAWDVQGLDGARSALPPKNTFHVRVGLARAFEKQPTKCYMMLNAVL